VEPRAEPRANDHRAEYMLDQELRRAEGYVYVDYYSALRDEYDGLPPG